MGALVSSNVETTVMKSRLTLEYAKHSELHSSEHDALVIIIIKVDDQYWLIQTLYSVS